MEKQESRTRRNERGEKRKKKETIDQTLNLKRQGGNGWTWIGHERKKVEGKW